MSLKDSAWSCLKWRPNFQQEKPQIFFSRELKYFSRNFTSCNFCPDCVYPFWSTPESKSNESTQQEAEV